MVLTITIFYCRLNYNAILSFAITIFYCRLNYNAILSFAITIILYVYHNYHNSQNTINVTLKRLVIVADHSRFNPL